MAPLSSGIGDSDVEDDFMEASEGEENTTCRKCKNIVNDTELSIFCEGRCQAWYHAACVNITKKQINQINQLKNVIVWMCTGCKKSIKNLWKVNKNNNNLLEKLKNIEDKLDTLGNPHNNFNTVSYAGIIIQSIVRKKKAIEYISHEQTLVLKPKKYNKLVT